MSWSRPEDLAARLLRSRWILPIVAVPILVVLLLASFAWPDNRFTLQATSPIVRIVADAKVAHEQQILVPPDAELLVSGYRIQDPPFELGALRDRTAPLRLKSDQPMRLLEIALSPKAELTLTQAADGSPAIWLGGGAGMSIALAGAVRLQSTSESWQEIARLEHAAELILEPAGDNALLQLSFAAIGKSPSPAIRDQKVIEIRFSRPLTNPQAPLFRSEITAGTLRLLDTGQEVKLRPGEPVWLETMSANVTKMAWTSEGIVIEATGRTGSIGVGPPRQGCGEPGPGWLAWLRCRLPGADRPQPDRDLTPSVLGYLVGQHELKLLWGAAAAVILALWKARQWAMKAGK